MIAFEKYNLKDHDQKGAPSLTKPEFRQRYLAPIRCLEPREQSYLLLKCKMKEISLKELKKEASNLKQIAALKKSFVKLTNSGSWEDAATKFPLHACEHELKKFIALDPSKGTPKCFVDFCKRAKSSSEVGCTVGDQTFIQSGNVQGYIIKNQPSELSGLTITKAFPSFQGGDLILLSIEPVSC